MTDHSHETLVGQQFGPQAAAYVASSVHAAGEDLLYLVGVVNGQAEAGVLDLGCGGGHVSFNVAPHVREVVAFDLSPDMLAAVAAEAKTRHLANVVPFQGTVEHLPFAEESFDYVFSRFSAHHWLDFDQGLAEARRVLKPGGRAVFSDVISPGPALPDTFLQAIELLRDPSHVRNRSADEWQQALIAAGFLPGTLTRRRLRLEFSAWVTRMNTPPGHVQAIRSLQARMPREVARHFAQEADGSFTVDTMTIEAIPG